MFKLFGHAIYHLVLVFSKFAVELEREVFHVPDRLVALPLRVLFELP